MSRNTAQANGLASLEYAEAMSTIPIAGVQDDEAEKSRRDAQAGSGEESSLEGKSDAGVEAGEGGEKRPVAQEDGVTRIEALYVVFGKGWGLYSLWISIGLLAYVYALSRSTTFAYDAFATSSFGEHTVVGTIGVVNAIVRGVSPPFIAKLADVWSRPHTYCVVVACFSVGYAMCAGAQNVGTVVAGQVIYTIGNAGITFLNSLILADITSLQWRGFVNGAINLPYVINAFVGAEITAGINGYSANGWRWGFGMFAIMMPVCTAPMLIVLFMGDRRARQIGVLSLATATNSTRQAIAGEGAHERTRVESLKYYLSRFNVFGFLLMGFAFALLLTPITLSTTAKGGYKNPSLIAMLVVGGLLFICWVAWDCMYAAYPIMPRRVLNRTFFACLAIDFFYFFSSYLVDAYFLSWVWVVVDWTDKEYSYFGNTVSVTMCSLAIFVGVLMRVTHRYKWLQIGGLCVRCLGVGLTYYATKRPTDGVLVSSQVLVGLGGAVTITASYVAVQASVPHQDMGIAVAVLNLWSSIGSSISIAISASVWNRELPKRLTKYLGATHNSTQIQEIFGSIYVARVAEPRELVKLAYMESVRGLFLAALIVMFVALAAGFFASNYYLGQAHNAIETDKIIKFRDQKEIDRELEGVRARAAEVEREKMRAGGADRRSRTA